MSQDSIVLNTTPPYPGADLVNDVNKAFQTLGTDFAGATDPATILGSGVAAYMTWADAGNNLIKRRNAVNTDWAVEGTLFTKPLPILLTMPASNVGPYMTPDGVVMRWDVIESAYRPAFGVGGRVSRRLASQIDFLGNSHLGNTVLIWDTEANYVAAGFLPTGLPSATEHGRLCKLTGDGHINLWEVTPAVYGTHYAGRKFRVVIGGAWDGNWFSPDVAPIGSQYTQYPGMSDPATLFGGTWQLQFATEGVFFRTEGGNALAFGGGIMEDAFQGHGHSIGGGQLLPQSGTNTFCMADLAGGSTLSTWRATAPISDGVNGTPRIANETRPRNRTKRVWLKTAY